MPHWESGFYSWQQTSVPALTISIRCRMLRKKRVIFHPNTYLKAMIQTPRSTSLKTLTRETTRRKDAEYGAGSYSATMVHTPFHQLSPPH